MSRGIDNKDSGAFKSSSELVGRVHRTARDLERTIENLSVDHLMDGVAGGAVGSGLRGGATLQVANSYGGGAQKREEERRKFTRAMHAALRRMEEIDLRLGELDREISQHKANISVIDRMIEEIQANGELEVNDDGTLKNDEYERLRKQYEKRTGKKLDPNDSDAMLIALMEQREWEKDQLDRKGRERDELEQEKDDLEASLEKTSHIVDRDERIEKTGEVLKQAKADTREAAITDMDEQVRKDEAREALDLDVETQRDFDQSGQTGEIVERAAFKPAGFKPKLGGLSDRPTSIAKLTDKDAVDAAPLKPSFTAAAKGDGAEVAPATLGPVRLTSAPETPSNVG